MSLAVRIWSMASPYACVDKSVGVWVIVRDAVAAVGRPVVSRDACCAWWMVSISVRGGGMGRKGADG